MHPPVNYTRRYMDNDPISDHDYEQPALLNGVQLHRSTFNLEFSLVRLLSIIVDV